MKITFKTALIVFAATMMSLSASAQRGRSLAGVDIDIDFDFVEDRRGPAPRQQVMEFPLSVQQDIFFHGDKLHIKQMLNNQYPRRNFDNFDFKAVVLVAKAGARGLDAQLLAGPRYKSRPQALTFNGRGSFPQPGNFGRTRFQVPEFNGPRGNDGRLQIEFSGQGRGKVKEVIVRAVRKGHNGGGQGRLQFTEIETFRTQKFIELTQRIVVRQRDVLGFKLEADRNPVDITSVVVVYGSGDMEHLPSLEGALNKGDSRQVRLGRRGQTVRRIEITATSLLPWGPRGDIKVFVGQ